MWLQSKLQWYLLVVLLSAWDSQAVFGTNQPRKESALLLWYLLISPFSDCQLLSSCTSTVRSAGHKTPLIDEQLADESILDSVPSVVDG